MIEKMNEQARNSRRRLLGLALAVPLFALAGCESNSAGTLSGSPLNDDAALSVKVREALESSGDTANQGILVSLRDNSVVRLAGIVNSDGVRHRAEQIASGVDGVNGVINTLTLRDN